VPAAVHLVLRDADPNGIVIATRDNWTGKAYGLPVGDLQYLLPALTGAGVYVLVGDDETSEDDLPVLYVGEAEDITSRLRPNHTQLSRSDVAWQRVVVFASQSDDLHKAHVRWLEAELVRLARLASRCRLANGNTPPSPKLPEFDEVFVRSFLENMLVLYPLLGVHAFTGPRSVKRPAPAPAAADVPVGSDELHEAVDQIELLLQVAGTTRARARVGSDQRLTLLAGSSIVREGRESESRKVSAVRRLLVDNGNVSARDGDWWELLVEHGPLSPSAAAELVVGYSINGRAHWKTESGTPYAELPLGGAQAQPGP
jgi:hypothetical protein